MCLQNGKAHFSEIFAGVAEKKTRAAHKHHAVTSAEQIRRTNVGSRDHFHYTRLYFICFFGISFCCYIYTVCLCCLVFYFYFFYISAHLPARYSNPRTGRDLRRSTVAYLLLGFRQPKGFVDRLNIPLCAFDS